MWCFLGTHISKTEELWYPVVRKEDHLCVLMGAYRTALNLHLCALLSAR